MLICVAIYSVYHVANYQHSRETKFGKSLAARLIVISGEIFYLLSICYAPIDVQLKSRGAQARENSRSIWLVLVDIQMIYVWIIFPLLFAFYDSDETFSICKRLWEAFRL